MNNLAEILEFDDGDSGGECVDAFDVLMTFAEMVNERHGPFKSIVQEMLREAVFRAAEGE